MRGKRRIEPARPETHQQPGAMGVMRAAWRTTWRTPVSAFVGSRILYLLTVFAIPALTHKGRSLSKPWASYLRRALFNSDGGWYYSIAVRGYDRVPFTSGTQHNWTFFPLYPYLTRWLHQVTGVPVLWVGYAISSLSFLGFLVALHAWARRHLAVDTARVAVLLAAFVPLTPYFVAYRADSLFLLLSVLSLDAIDRRRWEQALVWGAMASLTRPPGILLVVPYGIAVWLAEDGGRHRAAWLAGGAAFCFGFLVLAVIDRRVSGNAIAFLQGQQAWGKTVGVPFVSEIRDAGSMRTFTAAVGIGSALVVSAIGLAATAWLARRREWWPAAAYLGITILLSNASTSYLAIPRFITEVPPLFVGLALIAQRYRWQYAMLLASAGAMGLYSALWTLGVKGVQA